MRFSRLTIAGAVLVQQDRHPDERGHFARSWCAEEFAAQGLPSRIVQTSVSFNRRAGTLRGMHFQWPPSREDKLVRCTRGGVHDVLLDMRPDSPSYLQHLGILLDEESGDAVFIPFGIAHGFQTLRDNSEVLYYMTDTFAPELATGLRFDDPAFGIRWPLAVSVISEADRQRPAFDRTAFEAQQDRMARR